jgi:hypothetical protein
VPDANPAIPTATANGYTFTLRQHASVVPEPSTAALLVLGGCGVLRRRGRRSA